ncbi:ester cyclase [Ornithinimicrobium cryptoxanthini]|uniref:Ester cyclase n=1 Tax=Ornithinimicrobium cryptoxanthini TaxID=2934161 RepID=A0ABY4YIA9_9MICO|nr:ester cyclase [Ornithinimicrobium cryptoxanthini]USQ76083.1 ester cyclase [Ornithinimicrobium cryptoxanthini]
MSIQETQSVEETRQVMEAYAAEHDTSLIAPDAIFHDIASGQDYIGREAIAGMLHYVYHVAFQAGAEEVRSTIGDGAAVLEAVIVGTHIGEFAGVPATGREVRIPLVVSYRIADGYVQEASVYLLVSTFLQQVA